MNTNQIKTTKILNLPYPVIGLSPLDGITDTSFRQIIKKYGNPDLMFTEFSEVVGLCVAADKTLEHLHYEEMERPLIAQLYGKDPEYFYHAAKIAIALGFDGIDINMGCPAKNAIQRGAGAALIKTPDLAKEIVYQVKRGINDWVEDGKITGLKGKALRAVEELILHKRSNVLTFQRSNLSTFQPSNGQTNLLGKRVNIPVSIKTRIGYNEPITEKWIKEISTTSPAWISLHGRSFIQMYSGKADWNEIKKAVECTNIPIIGNGDIKEYSDITRMLEQTGVQGVLIGRGALGNPFIFKNLSLTPSPSPLGEGGQRPGEAASFHQTASIMLEHAKLFSDLHNNNPIAFLQMRKHLAWYCRDFDGAKELRGKLMRVKNIHELSEIIENII